jgi:ABC-type uncharacterized transport system permease subunit
MMNLFKFALLASTIRLATPLLLAALGGMFSERAGVINIALEGLMLAGAFTAATVTHLASVHGYPGAPWIGLLAAVMAGVVVAGIHAVACIKYKADQVVTGTAINILFLGVPALLSGALFDSTGATPQIPLRDLMPASLIVAALAVVLYAAFIVRATALKNQSRGVQLGTVLILAGAIWPVATWIALALVPISWYVLGHTPFGLRLRAVGENPEAADTAGVSVARIRYTGVLLSGALAAIGGAYLSIGQSSLFTRNMTAGRGFIALAALIFGKWRPVQTMLACLFFGFAEAVAIQMQGVVGIPVQFIQIIPYVLTIVVLAGFIGLSRAPRALGIPYQKEK